jgi:TonB-dependent receptor-like protein/carboxypeptidase-like protein
MARCGRSLLLRAVRRLRERLLHGAPLRGRLLHGAVRRLRGRLLHGAALRSHPRYCAPPREGPFPSAVTALEIGLVSLVLVAWAPAAWAVRVSGVVVDRGGRVVEFATVAVRALKLGAAADEHGRFALELPPGPATLAVAQLGYRETSVAVEVRDGLPPLRIVLEEQPVPLAEVTVTASTFPAEGRGKGATVRRMDVYTTPGAAADLFQAVRALPGLNAPVEGAALYVRGGDPRETLVRLDGGVLGHPYHAEGASGGLFSILDTYMIKSASFSSGGFPARYGGVLSGVLDIETQDPLDLRTVSANLNMVGGGLSSSWALVPGRLSLVGSFSRSSPALLFRLYGSASEFESAPRGSSGFGRLIGRYSPQGQLAFSWLEADDAVAVEAERLNATAVFRDRTRNRYLALHWRDVLAGRVALRAQAAMQRYDTHWSFQDFGGRRAERNLQGHLEGVWPIAAGHEITFGTNLRRFDTEITGLFPADSTDWLPGAPGRVHRTHPVTDYPGFYVEDKMHVRGPLYAVLGGRLDFASQPGTWTADPRAALAWRLDEHQTLRVAGGRYHQLADPEQLDPTYGNPELRPLRADHAIVGYEWASDFGTVRVEGYRKSYRNLVTDDPATFYANRGHGIAQGLDLLVQGTLGPMSGWITYGWLDSRRQEGRAPFEAPSEHGVKHSVILVGRCRLSSAWEVGARYHFRTGRPFTPIVGASYDSARAIWRPIEGGYHEDRLPDYNRLDVRATRLFSVPAGWGLPASSVCVLYAEALNALGIRNVLDYVYSEDYSRRRSLESYFGRRYVVAGVSLSW